MKEMISRRSFLRVMGLGFGAAMLTACKTGTADSPADSPAESVPDADTPVPFLTEDEFPRLDGSTACIPLMAQMKADVTGMDLLEAQTGITVSTTAYAWENFGLWSRSDSEDYGAQLLIVYEAPEYVKEELAEADAKLEQKAIGRDALVFIVNEENPVQSLTQQQLRDIYAGRITSWKDVGGADADIVAFQRGVDSGSQTLFKKLLIDKGDGQLMAAPTELAPADMGGLVDSVAEYNNSANAIGFSVYYYIDQMYSKPGLRLLSVGRACWNGTKRLFRRRWRWCWCFPFSSVSFRWTASRWCLRWKTAISSSSGAQAMSLSGAMWSSWTATPAMAALWSSVSSPKAATPSPSTMPPER